MRAGLLRSAFACGLLSTIAFSIGFDCTICSIISGVSMSIMLAIAWGSIPPIPPSPPIPPMPPIPIPPRPPMPPRPPIPPKPPPSPPIPPNPAPRPALGACCGLVLVAGCSEVFCSDSAALMTAWKFSPSMRLSEARGVSSFRIFPECFESYLCG